MSTTELVLVRHAETVWNAEERWQGQTDVALSERGRGEVAKVAARLSGERFDRVVSSDLSRAYDTARGIVGAAPIEREPALREMHLGGWCGLPHREVLERFPDELRALQMGEDRRIGGDGETVVELAARVTAVLAKIARESAGQRVLIVTHGGVIRAAMLDLLDLSGKTRPLFGARNTAITRVTIEGGQRTLRSYNDARHLAHDPLDGEEMTRGPGGRDHVVTLLGLASSGALGPASDHAETRTVPGKKQLVSYALEPRE